jgi:hypothetical protein
MACFVPAPESCEVDFSAQMVKELQTPLLVPPLPSPAQAL